MFLLLSETSLPWWLTVIYGIIEGITEFLPISSTGHLLIAQYFWGSQGEAFTVIIQAGAILAVVFIYWKRLLDLVLNATKPDQLRYNLKLALAFGVTAVCGLVLKKMGWELPETLLPVILSVAGGAVAIFIVDRPKAHHERGDEEPSWNAAFWIGLAQVLAMVFPGLSRSGATIIIAMLCGTRRTAATEFSFLVSIPTMFAASAKEGYDAYQEDQFTGVGIFDLALGFVVSMIVAFVAVKWLLGFVRGHNFIPFAWYRIVLALVLTIFLVTGVGHKGEATPAAGIPESSKISP